MAFLMLQRSGWSPCNADLTNPTKRMLLARWSWTLYGRAAPGAAELAESVRSSCTLLFPTLCGANRTWDEKMSRFEHADTFEGSATLATTGCHGLESPSIQALKSESNPIPATRAVLRCHVNNQIPSLISRFLLPLFLLSIPRTNARVSLASAS